jgi:type I restriction enzyme M protein
MNLAVHGLSGDIREANTYYEDVYGSLGKFDFVMTNPPFNVKKVDFEKVKGDPRWPFGLPSTDNANYLWIQVFYSALNEKGRAGFVMANSAADARGAEAEIRRKLIQANAIDVIIAIGPKFFYTVTLPCMLWFFDKSKSHMERKEKILFIDAGNIFRQIDKAHREFTPEHIEQLAGIVRSYRKETGAEKYQDVQGLCKVATFAEIEEQGWSLNPGRYIGITKKKEEDYNFKENLETLNKELEELNEEADLLEKTISKNISELVR